MGLLQDNQILAAEAVAYVKQQRLYGTEKAPRGIVAFNNADTDRWDPLLRIRSDDDFERMRQRLSEAADMMLERKGEERHGKRVAKLIAGEALKEGFGNCTEQAAIAFRFLKKKGALPLDIMTAEYRARLRNGRIVDDTHHFVLVGRPDGTESRNMGSWGAQAVVCDPWAPREPLQVYVAPKLGEKMREVLGEFVLAGSIARINGAGQSEW